MSAAGRPSRSGAAPAPPLPLPPDPRAPSRVLAAGPLRGRPRPGETARKAGRERGSSPSRLPAAGRPAPPAHAEGLENRLAQGLAPVIDRAVHTLILGSFPSRASLARGQYYGHPRNHFWPLLQSVLGEPLVALPYERRLEILLARGIGLWDVIGRCDRPGSLDSNIRRAERNAFDALLGSLPRLRRVFFNGATAGRAGPAFAARGLEVQVLPSSSPALTIGLPAKLVAWAAIAEPVAAGTGSSGTASLSSAMAASTAKVSVRAARASRAARTTGAAGSTAPTQTRGSLRAHRTVGSVGVTGTTDANSAPGRRALNATAEAESAAGSVRRERGDPRSTPRVLAQPSRVGHGDPAC